MPQPEKSSNGVVGREGRSEEILGQVQAVAELALGIENLRIVVTNRRLIVAHVRKKGVAALASVPFLGKLALDRLEKEKGGSAGGQKNTSQSVAEVLGADKDNFQVDQEDVVMAELHKSPLGLRILILTKDDKFQFATRENPVEVERLLRRVLGTKVVVRMLR